MNNIDIEMINKIISIYPEFDKRLKGDFYTAVNGDVEAKERIEGLRALFNNFYLDKLVELNAKVDTIMEIFRECNGLSPMDCLDKVERVCIDTALAGEPMEFDL
jgi:hypothetical protein